MALNFDGSSFVAVDDDAFGNGEGTLTQPLDAAVEAAIHSNHIHIAQGLNIATWTPYTDGGTGTAPGDNVRPYASMDWMTIAPIWRIPFMPGDVGIDIDMGYRVRDFGDTLTTNTLSYWIRAMVPGLGGEVVELSSTDWNTTRITVNFNIEVVRPLWLPVRIFGRSEIYPTANDSADVATAYIRDTMGSTYYSAGNNSNEPNTTTPDVQVTKAISNGIEQFHDHVAYDDSSVISNPGMVLNPSIDPGATYTAVPHFMSFIQIHGMGLRTFQDPGA